MRIVRPATVLWLLLLAGAASAPVAAAPPGGLERLQAFLDRVQSMRAEFRQEIVNADQAVVETATGRMALKRPGRFRWDYRQPYERAVVADGTRLWLYEADLQQVTVRPLTAGLGETPAALLTGERGILDRFEFVSSWAGDDLLWVRLKPRSADADFESVAIGFAGDKPARFELDDRLGQRTRIILADVTLNPPVAEAEFRFQVPAGVDVIREGEL